jgi:hypothetical protein
MSKEILLEEYKQILNFYDLEKWIITIALQSMASLPLSQIEAEVGKYWNQAIEDGKIITSTDKRDNLSGLTKQEQRQYLNRRKAEETARDTGRGTIKDMNAARKP